ncbi:unnamed protein product [Adineta steineri]|uniref:EGF-like domain-containing protein n=1 Tax=Adineta steineri TaxID=433720 RepID=A0A814JAY6_9BILA|nr:unnamed protein product [Adineta steineri]
MSDRFAIGDLNNDQDVDIVFVDKNEHKIFILLGNGDGYFSYQNEATFSIINDTLPTYITLADFNRDTCLDIAITNHDKDHIRVFRGNCGGYFSEESTFYTDLYSSPVFIHAADFDRDGILDIISWNSESMNLGIFLEYGDTGFKTQKSSFTGLNSKLIDIDIADFNNDTHPDVIFIYNTHMIAIMFGLGNGFLDCEHIESNSAQILDTPLETSKRMSIWSICLIVVGILIIAGVVLVTYIVTRKKEETQANTWTKITTLSTTTAITTSTKAVCSPACLNGGTCTQPNFCDCTKDWKGAYCETDNKCYYGKDQVQLVNGEKRSIEYLKVGDRVWSISPDGSSLIEDEIVMMADSGPNTPTMFYTFKTIEGYEVSLTNRHTIPVFDPNDNQIRIVRSSQVTREHYLIMYNKKSAIENISINTRIGFYAPLTLTGYLAVNNISTSVFSDSYRLSQNSFQHAFMPVRVYYHVMRWYFGKTYNPFETNIKEGLHPVVAFYKQHSGTIRTVVLTIENVIPALLIIFILYYIQKIFIRLFYSGLDKSN